MPTYPCNRWLFWKGNAGKTGSIDTGEPKQEDKKWIKIEADTRLNANSGFGKNIRRHPMLFWVLYLTLQ
jgi:hypothetical protein